MRISLRRCAASGRCQIAQPVTPSATRFRISIEILDVLLGIRLVEMVKRVVLSGRVQQNDVVNST